ncbi:MAG: EF-P lysine aminoacylase GenX, partial [Gammaproteobacteria bacterium]|nr:EF-P lysine aminoacylase GenX [Gammaproteobacteria bacterium]
RLLAAGVGDCWQLARVFRDGERGRLHSPEFDLLEWYRVGLDHHALMDEVATLVHRVVEPERPVPDVSKLTYRAAFVEHAGIDPLEADTAQLRRAADALGVPVSGLGEGEREDWLDALLATAVVPALPRERLVFVHDWPAPQAALARLAPHDP